MNIKKRELAILLALNLGITSALAGCGVSSQSSGSSAVARTAEDIQGETAPEELQTANQAGTGEIPPVSSANLTEEDAANPVPDKFHVELEEVSRVSGKDNYRIHDQSLQHVEGDSCTFCDFNGNPVDSRPVHYVKYLGWDLYSVTLKSEDDINCTGLVDTAGNILIPFEAAVIEFPGNHPEDERSRYILVSTGTEVTSNENEALFSAWKYMFACVTSNNLLYKGTLRVFDLVNGQYVPGLEYEHASRYDFSQVGDNILEDVGDKAVLYSPDGKEIYTEQGSLTCNYRYLLDRNPRQNVIMDSNGVQLYTSDTFLSTIDYKTRYFLTANNPKWGAVDCRGETVLPAEYNFIVSESKDRFILQNDSSSRTLITKDGSVIASDYVIREADSLGFLSLGREGNYSLVTPGNRVIKDLDTDSRFRVFTKGNKAFYPVINTGEFVPCDDYYCNDIGKGVLALCNSEYKYKLVDVFTGNDLSGFDYDRAWYINDDYLYVEEGDDIVIYKTVVVPEG